MAQINWANPITKGLVALCVPEGNNYRELVTNVLGTVSGTVYPMYLPNNGGCSLVPYAQGRYMDNAQTNYVAWPASSTKRGGNITSQFTLLTLGSSLVSGTGQRVAIGSNCDSDITGHSIGLGIDQYELSVHGGVMASYSYAGAGAAVSSDSALTFTPENKLHCFGYASDGSNCILFYRGRYENKVYSFNAASNQYRALRLHTFGQTSGILSTANNHNSFVAWFAIWERPISASEYASIYANPWQLFLAPQYELLGEAIYSPEGVIIGYKLFNFFFMND